VVTKIEIPDNQYWKFFKTKQGKVWRNSLDLHKPQLEFNQQAIHQFDQGTQFFLSKVVNLPNDRVFLIGGAEDLNCRKSFNTMYEFVWNQEQNKYEMVQKANMQLARAAFGCVVYPNHT
jgi:hypothetical protein